MSLIQPKKFRTWETGLFKMTHLETPRFQTAVKVTVASGHTVLYNTWDLKNYILCICTYIAIQWRCGQWNCDEQTLKWKCKWRKRGGGLSYIFNLVNTYFSGHHSLPPFHTFHPVFESFVETQEYIQEQLCFFSGNTFGEWENSRPRANKNKRTDEDWGLRTRGLT